MDICTAGQALKGRGRGDYPFMKFRMIWLGSEDDSDRHASAPEGTVAAPEGLGCVRYEQRGTEIVRREQLGNARVKLTPVANFTARIVRDIICDDDTEHRRDFGVEAESFSRPNRYIQDRFGLRSASSTLERRWTPAICLPTLHQPPMP